MSGGWEGLSKAARVLLLSFGDLSSLLPSLSALSGLSALATPQSVFSSLCALPVSFLPALLCHPIGQNQTDHDTFIAMICRNIIYSACRSIVPLSLHLNNLYFYCMHSSQRGESEAAVLPRRYGHPPDPVATCIRLASDMASDAMAFECGVCMRC